MIVFPTETPRGNQIDIIISRTESWSRVITNNRRSVRVDDVVGRRRVTIFRRCVIRWHHIYFSIHILNIYEEPLRDNFPSRLNISISNYLPWIDSLPSLEISNCFDRSSIECIEARGKGGWLPLILRLYTKRISQNVLKGNIWKWIRILNQLRDLLLIKATALIHSVMMPISFLFDPDKIVTVQLIKSLVVIFPRSSDTMPGKIPFLILSKVGWFPYTKTDELVYLLLFKGFSLRRSNEGRSEGKRCSTWFWGVSAATLESGFSLFSIPSGSLNLSWIEGLRIQLGTKG